MYMPLTFIGAEHIAGPGPDPWEPGHVDALHERARTNQIRDITWYITTTTVENLNISENENVLVHT